MDRGGVKALEHPSSGTTGRARGAQPIAAPVAAEIMATKRRFPDFGLKKVRDYMARFAGLRVSTGGVRAVLAREGMPPTMEVPRRGRRRTRPAVRRFERAAPGQLWQGDFTSCVLGRSGHPQTVGHSTDNGSPYTCADFEACMVRQRVVHLKDLPHTPQHNARAEPHSRRRRPP